MSESSTGDEGKCPLLGCVPMDFWVNISQVRRPFLTIDGNEGKCLLVTGKPVSEEKSGGPEFLWCIQWCIPLEGGLRVFHFFRDEEGKYVLCLLGAWEKRSRKKESRKERLPSEEEQGGCFTVYGEESLFLVFHKEVTRKRTVFTARLPRYNSHVISWVLIMWGEDEPESDKTDGFIGIFAVLNLLVTFCHSIFFQFT